MDDKEILELASKSTIYLHLRDEAGEVPSKYIQSQYFYNSFLKRNNFEVGRLPYPKEHQAHLDYLHESVELGFTSTINQRIAKMFIDSNPFKFDAELSLKIPRESIFKYSYAQLHHSLFSWYTPSFYGRFFISFENEAAIDMSGVTLDWLSSLIEIFFKANPEGDADSFTAPLFQPVSDDSNLYQPTGLYSDSVYKFAGSIVALALMHGISTRVEFIPSFYRVVLEIEPYRFDDLNSQSPTVFKNLNSLKEAFNNHKPLDYYDFKTIAEVEKYIENYSADLLYRNHKPFLKAFATGFRSKIPRKISKYLDLIDLKNILKGPIAVTTEDFKRNLVLNTADSLTKQIFFQVIDELSQQDRFELIKFVTGRHGLPFGGLAELPQRIKVIFDMQPKDHLPTASTCTSTLHLAKFNSASELKSTLLKAFEYCGTLENS